jgi:hypothetical protein
MSTIMICLPDAGFFCRPDHSNQKAGLNANPAFRVSLLPRRGGTLQAEHSARRRRQARRAPAHFLMPLR